MENPIRRKANHNEIPSGNLRKSKIFAGRVKTLPYTSGVRATLQTGILQHAPGGHNMPPLRLHFSKLSDIAPEGCPCGGGGWGSR